MFSVFGDESLDFCEPPVFLSEPLILQRDAFFAASDEHNSYCQSQPEKDEWDRKPMAALFRDGRGRLTVS